MARGFKIADAYVDIHADKDSLKREVADLPKSVGPDGDRAGRGIGDKVSQGMRMSFIRNSPIIVAALAGGLTAGAPLMTAAAVGLFATVGIVAAAQSEKVKSAWLGTWNEVKQGAIEDSSAIESVLTKLASTVASRFQDMRPALQDIFRDVAPQIDVFANGLFDLAENALPGFRHAVEASMPVTQGLADFLGSIGTGLTDFFDTISEHSGSSGQVFRELGQSMEVLLPLLGELFGVGSDLAASTLPLLTGSLSAMLTVVQVLAPIIPAIAKGFAAWKIMQTATGWVENLGARMTTTAAKGGMFSGALGAGGAAAGAAAGTIGALAAVVALVGMKMAEDESNADRWARAMMNGGKQATAAANETKASILGMHAGWMDSVNDWVQSIPIIGQAWDLFSTSSKEAAEDTAEAQKKIRDAMSESEKAQQDVVKAQNELNEAIDTYGPQSGMAAEAAGRLGEAQSKAAKLAEDQERAIRGVTEAMIAQVDQSRAMVDAEFANEDALISVQEATDAYAEAVRKHGKNSEEAAAAMRDLQRAYSDAGRAAGELAASKLPASIDDQTRAYFGARAELDYYQSLIAQGIDLPPWMDEHIAKLEQQVGGAAASAAAQDVLRASLEEVGVAVKEIPGTKSVVISGEGADEIATKLGELGFTIKELPDGKFQISANTPEAQAQLGDLQGTLTALDLTTAKPQIDVDDDQAVNDIDAFTTKLLGIDGFVGGPTVETDSDVQTQTDADWADIMGLSEATASPQIQAQSNVQTQTDADVADLLGLGGVVVTPQTQNQTNVPGTTQNDTGLLLGLGGVVATPHSDLDDSQLQGVVGMNLGMLGNLGNQRPTPVAGMANQPFINAMNSVGGWIGQMNAWHANPTVTATANTSGAEGSLNWLARARNAVINVIQKILPASGGSIGSYQGLAIGGQPGTKSGKVRGPGTTTSDSVGPFRTSTGVAYLSNLEWIIKAMSAQKYGDARMAAVNSGEAVVLLPREARELGLAEGGTTGQRMALSGERTGARISVGNVHVHIAGTFDFSKPGEIRRLGVKLRSVLDDLDREER